MEGGPKQEYPKDILGTAEKFIKEARSNAGAGGPAYFEDYMFDLKRYSEGETDDHREELFPGWTDSELKGLLYHIEDEINR